MIRMGALMLAAVVGLTSCGADDTIVLMAASSLTDVITGIDESGRFGAPVEPVFAGSTALVAQLREGADADLLVTADRPSMEQAIRDGSVEGEPTVLATNALVLAVAPGNPAAIRGLADLAQPSVIVGVCAAEVPCGALAGAATGGLGVIPSVDTEEPNVRALAAKISLGEVDAGLVYRTDAAALDLETVAVDGLDRFVTEYLVATVNADAAPAVAAVADALTDDPAVRGSLAAAGFGTPP